MNKLYIFFFLILISCQDTGPLISPDPDPEPLSDTIIDFVKGILVDGVFTGYVVSENHTYNSMTMTFSSTFDTLFDQNVILDSVYSSIQLPNWHVFRFHSPWVEYSDWIAHDTTILAEGIIHFGYGFTNFKYRYDCNLKEKTVITFYEHTNAPYPGLQRTRGYFTL